MEGAKYDVVAVQQREPEPGQAPHSNGAPSPADEFTLISNLFKCTLSSDSRPGPSVLHILPPLSHSLLKPDRSVLSM